MTTPRSLLVDPEQALCYHLVSRCVRRAWLCGNHDGHSYAHRKHWIEQRLMRLAQAFAVDLFAFAVMSNHFHLVVYYDPVASRHWTDVEVAERWLQAFPVPEPQHETAVLGILNEPERLQRYRERLGSLSAFMQHLKQPVAVRVNQEDGVKGHLFEQRFYSGALLDERSVLAAMRYVDLNPFRAQIAQTLREAEHTSIHRRLEALANAPERVDHYLSPLTSGCQSRSASISPQEAHAAVPRMTLRAYIALLEETIACTTARTPTTYQQSESSRWQQAASLLRKQQRAYGQASALAGWLQSRRFRCLERPTTLV